MLRTRITIEFLHAGIHVGGPDSLVDGHPIPSLSSSIHLALYDRAPPMPAALYQEGEERWEKMTDEGSGDT